MENDVFQNAITVQAANIGFKIAEPLVTDVTKRKIVPGILVGVMALNVGAQMPVDDTLMYKAIYTRPHQATIPKAPIERVAGIWNMMVGTSTVTNGSLIIITDLPAIHEESVPVARNNVPLSHYKNAIGDTDFTFVKA